MALPQAISAILDTKTELEVQLPVKKDRPAAVARGGIELAVETMSAVEADWRGFEQIADCTVFQSFDWLAAWQHHIGSLNGVVPTIVTGRDAHGELLFLLPLAVEARRFVRRLTWLGRDLCDYNGPMLAPGFTAGINRSRFANLWREVLQQLQDRPQLRFDVIHLDKMQSMVGGQANPFIDLGVMPHANGAYFTHLGGDWESFYASKRSAETRGRDRTKSKRLAKQGEVRFVSPTDDSEIASTLETLIEQKAKSLDAMGVADIFARRGHREFYHALALEPHLVHISRLDVGAQTVAANLGTVFRGRYYHILASYTDGELARFSPGAAHLHELLRYAIECRCDAFDFTLGDERYKQEWCDDKIVLFDHIEPATWAGWATALQLRTIGRVKRYIKQGPTRWQAAFRLRAALGPLTRRLRRT
jgi:CelD/BcsL family acetyltransferase involved in cellulose biosynthesis